MSEKAPKQRIDFLEFRVHKHVTTKTLKNNSKS